MVSSDWVGAAYEDDEAPFGRQVSETSSLLGPMNKDDEDDSEDVSASAEDVEHCEASLRSRVATCSQTASTSPYLIRGLAALLCVLLVCLTSWAAMGSVFSFMPIGTRDGLGFSQYSENCTFADRTYLSRFTGRAQPFFQHSADCGRKAINFLRLTWTWDDFQTCFKEAYPELSDTCVGCYNAQGQYGFAHCKLQCMRGWCTRGCLECNTVNSGVFYPCIGMSDETRPMAEEC